jgi:pyruvate dehydrogenase E1 component alpha subunit
MATETSLDGAARGLDTYRLMALIRAFEESAYRAYESGEITGTIHASIGQEAVAVGVISRLDAEDLVFTHHRGHAHALSKGVPPARLFGELIGKADGSSGGRGGSMHVTDRSVGFLGSTALVGGSIPLVVGVALAAKRRETGAVAVAFFGDGAANQGVLYESFNLASIWQLPVLFVCENNGYAISVPSTYATGGVGLVGRARAFGLKAAQVDGQSVIRVGDAAQELIEGARDRGEPAFLEALTYRFMGHSRGDPPHGLYRSKEEVEHWRERDPLIVHEQEAGLDEATCVATRSDVQAEVDAAFAEARAYPAPAADTVGDDVWGDR